MAVALRQAITITFLCTCIVSMASDVSAATSSQSVQFNTTIRDRATLTLPSRSSPSRSFQQVSQTFLQASATFRTGRTTPVEILLNGHRQQDGRAAGSPRVITWNSFQRSARSWQGSGRAVVTVPHDPALYRYARSPWKFTDTETDITIIIP